MATGHRPEAGAAMQYLSWAIEEIEKTGEETALIHARAALEQLHRIYSPPPSLMSNQRGRL